MTYFHTLSACNELPKQLNNPFCYTPHPLCLEAWEKVCEQIKANNEWAEDAQKGKMFGVLVVQNKQHKLGFIATYSGQLNGSYPEAFFIPPVFNYLAPTGYFKTHEREISRITEKIKMLTHAPHFLALLENIKNKKAEQTKALNSHKKLMAEAKILRDKKRELPLNEAEKEKLLNESRKLKADFKRLKNTYSECLQHLENDKNRVEQQLEAWKLERKQKSDALQQWLFSQFKLCNALGEVQDIRTIFEQQEAKTPPAGTGECCAPKLLHYAFQHELKPITMAEFWYGESPKGKIREHGQWYPACKDKCKPLLSYLLEHFPHEENALEQPKMGTINVLYEDNALLAIAKPSGLPSVKGLFKGLSVETWLEQRYPHIHTPMIVHRLDMDTSGIMIIAKTKYVHSQLQKQFEQRQVKKCYIALLEGAWRYSNNKGEIALPLRPDIKDRPKQMVDHQWGKQAITQYQVIATQNNHTRIALYPQTGRTHQLRVHCAHKEGLAMPIKGDRLYGRGEGRLCLHAQTISFQHPLSLRWITLENKAPF